MILAYFREKDLFSLIFSWKYFLSRKLGKICTRKEQMCAAAYKNLLFLFNLELFSRKFPGKLPYFNAIFAKRKPNIKAAKKIILSTLWTIFAAFSASP
jgi:hypothetical protein